MNIVFWLFIIIALVLVWFCLAPAFRRIGDMFYDMIGGAKKEISDEETKESEDNQK